MRPVALLSLLVLAAWPAAAHAAGNYVPGEVLLHDAHGTRAVRTPGDHSVRWTAGRLRARPGVDWAVPDYIAHAAYLPDDPGKGSGWQALQWNFLPGTGVDAPGAWDNLIRDGRPGGKGVVVAVLDSGIAYENYKRFRRSPDFTASQFVPGYDFVSNDVHPDDELGHGTFVAGTIAEKTNNGIGVTGLAYGAKIMPVRVLDRLGEGDAVTIGKGIRFAVKHGAQVINLSLVFDESEGASDIPPIISALRYARAKRVVVVGASGNDSEPIVAYPARAGDVISVGATSQSGCLASYSNTGSGLDLVAPGGGDSAILSDDPQCQAADPAGSQPIYQLTFPHDGQYRRFGYPSDYEGTSFAAPHAAAAAALVIASGVLGAHPRPIEVLDRLRATSHDLGPPGPDSEFGAGLLDAAAATAPST
ncbi:MAG TPA: S8 family serine peptidase [Solirubrobacteraceae bacterium]|nr:S8 family serine peptidase [Solirubrobacteraceae bacterium]